MQVWLWKPHRYWRRCWTSHQNRAVSITCTPPSHLSSYPTLVPYPPTLPLHPTLVPYPRTLPSYPTLVPYPPTLPSYPTLVPYPRTLPSYPTLLPYPRTLPSYPTLVPSYPTLVRSRKRSRVQGWGTRVWYKDPTLIPCSFSFRSLDTGPYIVVYILPYMSLLYRGPNVGAASPSVGVSPSGGLLNYQTAKASA